MGRSSQWTICASMPRNWKDAFTESSTRARQLAARLDHEIHFLADSRAPIELLPDESISRWL